MFRNKAKKEKKDRRKEERKALGSDEDRKRQINKKMLEDHMQAARATLAMMSERSERPRKWEQDQDPSERGGRWRSSHSKK